MRQDRCVRIGVSGSGDAALCWAAASAGVRCRHRRQATCPQSSNTLRSPKASPSPSPCHTGGAGNQGRAGQQRAAGRCEQQTVGRTGTQLRVLVGCGVRRPTCCSMPLASPWPWPPQPSSGTCRTESGGVEVGGEAAEHTRKFWFAGRHTLSLRAWWLASSKLLAPLLWALHAGVCWRLGRTPVNRQGQQRRHSRGLLLV